MKKLTLLLVIAGIVLVGIASGEPPAGRPDIRSSVEGPPVPWTGKPLNNDPDTFHFAIVSDLTGAERPGVFQKAVKVLNLLQPELVMSIGDDIQGYADNERVLGAQWKSFDDRLAALPMRFFYVPGNHDVGGPTPEISRKVWAARLGPTWYSFVYRNVLFLCLDSEQFADPRTDPAELDRQVSGAIKALDDNPDVRWTFVFLHHPLWVMPAGRWAEIEKRLAPRKHTVFCGHIHRYTKYTRHGQSYITLGTTGGGQGGTILAEGRFDEIAWVTVKEGGPVIANVMLDGVVDENVVTEEMVRQKLKGTRLESLVP